MSDKPDDDDVDQAQAQANADGAGCLFAIGLAIVCTQVGAVFGSPYGWGLFGLALIAWALTAG